MIAALTAIWLGAGACRMDNPDFVDVDEGTTSAVATTDGPRATSGGASAADLPGGGSFDGSDDESGTALPMDGSCPVDAARCGALCVDLLTNEEHCGACDLRCAADEYCDGGNCAPGCQEDQVLCGIECVDLMRDEAHCGACDNVCPSWSWCNDGLCECLAWGELCDGVCIDPRTNSEHCGTCGNACGPGKECIESECDE